MNKHLAAISMLALAGILSGCLTTPSTGAPPPSTPSPSVPTVDVTVASVTLSSLPTMLEIGKPISLSAIAKDTSGQTLPGRAFTWASSDPSVMTVDAGGTVIARRLGTSSISVKVDDKTATTGTVSTYGLEVVGGTNLLAAGLFGVTQETVGTLYTIRIRDVNGNKPTGTGTGQINGPSGWNANNPYSISPQSALASYSNSIPAITGIYKISLNFAGTTYNSTFSIDSSKRISYATGISMTSIKLDSITGSWNSVQGSTGYFAGDCANAIGWAGNVSSQTVTISPPYVKGEKHTFCVSTRDFDLNLTLRMPDQANSSWNRVEFLVP
jgi:hypothetical protein